MTTRLPPFVTQFVRERCSTPAGPDPIRRRLPAKLLETWAFVWDDLDRLFGHLQELASDPTSGFGLNDARQVMADARRQLQARADGMQSGISSDLS